MENVYIVTDGDYSSYHIVAAFSTPEKAAAFQTWYGGGEIESFVIDEESELIESGLRRYVVRMWRDGNSCVERDHWEEAKGIDQLKTTYAMMKEPTRPHVKGTFEYQLRVATAAKDEDHAVKIANETRAQLIANGQWPEG